MLRVELGRSKSTSDLYRAKEWSPIWIHEKIRFDYKAFCTMCLMLEIIDQVITKIMMLLFNFFVYSVNNVNDISELNQI